MFILLQIAAFISQQQSWVVGIEAAGSGLTP